MKTIPVALISSLCIILLYVWQLRTSDSPSKTDPQSEEKKILLVPAAARAYPKWNDFPCYHGSTVGLIYIKVKKAASTSMFNIVERFTYRQDPANKNKSPTKMNHFEQCQHHDDHIPAFRLDYAKNHTENKAFLFTFVRDPTQR